MNLFDAISTSSDIVTGRIASQIFSVLPEDGPGIAIIDRHGHRYTSEPELLGGHGISDEKVRDVCSRVDDGYEPVIAGSEGTTLICTHLSTDRCNYGYVILVMDGYCPVAAVANMPLVEMVLAQLTLIARLMEGHSDRHGYPSASSSAWAAGCLN
ncbi:MAG TPA: hypothetical protein VLH60_05785 [Sedimentisphaerales bacterium]|nr:hypothetical protein [Sedimentisphaerales bacterium]